MIFSVIKDSSYDLRAYSKALLSGLFRVLLLLSGPCSTVSSRCLVIALVVAYDDLDQVNSTLSSSNTRASPDGSVSAVKPMTCWARNLTRYRGVTISMTTPHTVRKQRMYEQLLIGRLLSSNSRCFNN